MEQIVVLARDKNPEREHIRRRNNVHGRTLSSTAILPSPPPGFSRLYPLSLLLQPFRLLPEPSSLSPPRGTDHRVISRSIGPQGQKGSNETDTRIAWWNTLPRGSFLEEKQGRYGENAHWPNGLSTRTVFLPSSSSRETNRGGGQERGVGDLEESLSSV